MTKQNKIILGSVIGTLFLSFSAFAVYKLTKKRHVRLLKGNDDDVIYVVLNSKTNKK